MELSHTCRKAITLDPNYAGTYACLGAILYDLGRLEEAETSYREAIRINPEFAEAHFNLGVTLGKLGKQKEAEACYREAIRINPKLAKAHANLGLRLFVAGKLNEARLHLDIARKNFEKEKEGGAAYLGAFVSWIDGFTSWQTGDLLKAKNGYISASKSFVKAGKEELAQMLTLIARTFAIDEAYMSHISSQNLAILKAGILDLSERLEKRLDEIGENSVAELQILYAKVKCIRFLKDVLFFESVGDKPLREAKQIFSKHHFVGAYEAANAIDTFRVYLNRFCPSKDLRKISEEHVKELFLKLNAAISLDGIVTQHFAEMMIERLKPELYSTVTRPLLEEERKTRKALTRKMDKIEEKLESIHITILGIEQEITVKRVTYGEFEIVFPTPLGIYKIHIPTGEITTQDLAKIRKEVSRIFLQVMEKAKETSAKLYNELKNKKQEVTQRILEKLRKLRNIERV